MILYHTTMGPVLHTQGRWHRMGDFTWDTLMNQDDLWQLLRDRSEGGGVDAMTEAPRDWASLLLPPVQSQEVWAAGVTYLRSRTARMEESDQAGASQFYDRVYNAERPELFFKATPHRVVGHGGKLKLRPDSKWIVPEPELTLALTKSGRIIGYTIGNDLSCRDIEGENPLYLPQAKTFDGCCALGPGVLVTREPPADSTEITIRIERAAHPVFEGRTSLSQMKKKPAELADWLFRANSFPAGCMLLTGTGIVPPNDFSLQPRDQVTIRIDGIGQLSNSIE